MARVHGKDLAVLTLGGQTLLADTIALDFKVSSDVHDAHTMGDDWKESIGGLKGGDDISHEMFYDNTVTTGTWAYVTNLLGTSSTLAFGDGTRNVSVSAIVKEISLPIKVADMMKMTVTYRLTGAVSFT